MSKEFASKERRIPLSYERVGEPPAELRDIFENLWVKGLFPSFESLPPQITLTSQLNNLIDLELANALERKERKITRSFFHTPDVGIFAGERRPGGFSGKSQSRATSYAFERYNLAFLGIVRPHPFKKEALFSQEEMVYFLSNPKDLFIIAVAKEGIRLALKSQETKSEPYSRIHPLLFQYYKFCETDSFKKIKEKHPEISEEELFPVLHRQTELAFNLKVAQEFMLGLYSSSEKNTEILKRIH